MRVRTWPEQLVMGTLAGWLLLLAVVTLIPYRVWFQGNGEDALAATHPDGGAGLMSELTAVLVIYGLGLVAAAVVSGLLTVRLPHRQPRVVLVWFGVCAVGALVTTDLIGCLLAVVGLVVAGARHRARRMAARAAAT